MSIAPNERRAPKFGLTHRLVLAREVAGLDQQAVADALDVSRGTISNYERGIGKKGISKLQLNAWAVVCEVDVEWLKTGIEQSDSGPGGVSAEDSGKITVR